MKKCSPSATQKQKWGKKVVFKVLKVNYEKNQNDFILKFKNKLRNNRNVYIYLHVYILIKDLNESVGSPSVENLKIHLDKAPAT